MSGIVPKDLKISKLVPINKNGDKNDPSIYRPISILLIMDKIVSTLVNEQLIKYLKKHNIIQRHRDNKRLVIVIF